MEGSIRPIDGKKFSILETSITRNAAAFFASKEKYVKNLVDIIAEKTQVSIRLIDWFVTKHSEANNISYLVRDKTNVYAFHVSSEYKTQLNAYKKKYFDPNARGTKVTAEFHNSDDTRVIQFNTSICQLNFFQWAIRNKIIEYITMNVTKLQNYKSIDVKNHKARHVAHAPVVQDYEDYTLSSDSEELKRHNRRRKNIQSC